jgi:hypothetical protein
MPSVTMKANSEIMLMDTPVAGISIIVPRKDTGMPSVTQKLSCSLRKRPSVTKTRMRPMRALRIKRSMRSRYISESSLVMATARPGGRRSSNSSSFSRTASATAIGVSSPTRYTSMSTARCP